MSAAAIDLDRVGAFRRIRSGFALLLLLAFVGTLLAAVIGTLLFMAGLDTVTASLGWIFLRLATHPAEQAQLRQRPELIPGAVEELLRTTGIGLLESLFESDAVRRFLTALPALNLFGDLLEPGQCALAWVWSLALRAAVAPAGNQSLVKALERSFIADGGVFLRSTTVTEIVVEGGRCVGAVVASSGSEDTETLWADGGVVSNLGAANRLYHNNGNGTFTDVARTLGVTGPRDSFPVWFWDFDNDGALDIFVSTYYQSLGPARLAEQPEQLLIALREPQDRGPAALRPPSGAADRPEH